MFRAIIFTMRKTWEIPGQVRHDGGTKTSKLNDRKTAGGRLYMPTGLSPETSRHKSRSTSGRIGGTNRISIKNFHEVWAAYRIANGFKYGPVRDEIKK